MSTNAAYHLENSAPPFCGPQLLPMMRELSNGGKCTLTVSDHDCQTGKWYRLKWTNSKGIERTAAASRINLCLWRAIAQFVQDDEYASQREFRVAQLIAVRGGDAAPPIEWMI